MSRATDETKLAANGIELDVAQYGPAGARPLLLIRGLGTQRIHWDEAFLEALVARGFRVITFDNRDVGASTWFDQHPAPPLPDLAAALTRGDVPDVPYQLDDMADDAAGLLDALSIDRAHVMGISMGGMIAQVLALRHPGRVASLASVMSSTGERDLPQATDEAMAALREPAPTEREAYLEYFVRTSRAFTGPGFPYDEPAQRDLAGRAFDRAFHPAGVARQMAAIVAAPGRRSRLAALDVPAVVIHGDGDPLVRPAAGADTARAIPAAEYLVIEGMGHDLPRGTWDRIGDALVRVAERAED